MSELAIMAFDPSLAEKSRFVTDLNIFDALLNDRLVGMPAELNARRQQFEHYHSGLPTFKVAET